MTPKTGNDFALESSQRPEWEIPVDVTDRDSSCAKGDSNPHTVKY